LFHDTYSTKNSLYFDLGSHNANNLTSEEGKHEKIAQHDLSTKLEGFEYLLVTLTIVDIFAFSFPRWM
jgi:hypothetical protein